MCPLCEGNYRLLCETNRKFFLCLSCDLVFADPQSHLPAAEEEARYRSHNNDLQDPRYRQFLAPMLEALSPRLSPGSKGLDYGAGPGPLLAMMFSESGYPTRCYDPFFHPDPAVLEDTYDFLICTEAAEHFHHPAREFTAFNRLLGSEGWIGIMTKRLDDWRGFKEWYYARDPTHVVFYSTRTMQWIANRFKWELSLPSDDLALFRR